MKAVRRMILTVTLTIAAMTARAYPNYSYGHISNVSFVEDQVVSMIDPPCAVTIEI